MKVLLATSDKFKVVFWQQTSVFSAKNVLECYFFSALRLFLIRTSYKTGYVGPIKKHSDNLIVRSTLLKKPDFRALLASSYNLFVHYIDSNKARACQRKNHVIIDKQALASLDSRNVL